MKFPSKYFILLACLILVFSCKSFPDKPPIPIHKMSQVLLDIQVAEAYSLGLGNDVKNKYEKNYDSLGSFYISILKHHDISYDDYNNAIGWYKNHPMMMDSLLGAVTKELSTVRKRENIKDVPAAPAPVAANPYTGNPKTDSLMKAANKRKTDSTKRAEDIKETHLKDSLKLAGKHVTKISKADSAHKKTPTIKKEP